MWSFSESSDVTVRNPVLPLKLRGLEAKIGAARVQGRLQQPRIGCRRKIGNAHILGRSDLKKRVQCTAGVFRHQDFHLPLWQVFDRLVLRARLAILSFACTASLFVFAKSE